MFRTAGSNRPVTPRGAARAPAARAPRTRPVSAAGPHTECSVSTRRARHHLTLTRRLHIGPMELSVPNKLRQLALTALQVALQKGSKYVLQLLRTIIAPRAHLRQVVLAAGLQILGILLCRLRNGGYRYWARYLTSNEAVRAREQASTYAQWCDAQKQLDGQGGANRQQSYGYWGALLTGFFDLLGTVCMALFRC